MFFRSVICFIFVIPQLALSEQALEASSSSVEEAATVSETSLEDSAYEDKLKEFSSQFIENALSLINDSSLDVQTKVDKISELCLGILDIDKMRTFALGRRAKIFTEEQATRWESLFQDYIVAIYTQTFQSQGTSNFSIELKDVKTQQEANTATLSYSVKLPDKVLSVGLSLDISDRENPLVYDLNLAGVSVLLGLSRDLRRIWIKQKDAEKFLNQIEEKVNELKN